MTDTALLAEPTDNPVDELRARAELLERKLTEFRQQSDTRLIRAEMKVEAIRAGMIDLDGLKLLELSSVKLNEKGEIDDAFGLMARFKKAKPWLFGTPSSSSSLSAPLVQPPRQKLATEMTNAEYAVARAALLKQRY
jgi:hypothetical protein